MSRLPPDAVAAALADIRSFVAPALPQAEAGHSAAQINHFKAAAMDSRVLPRLKRGQQVTFEALLSEGIPLIVWNAGSALKGRWDPAAFIASHGGDEVDVIVDNETGPRQMTVRDFFLQFQRDTASRAKALKLKVWFTSLCCRLPFH